MSTIQTDIEARLAASEPDVEVLLAEVLGRHTLRLFIDHPDGVTLGAVRARHPCAARAARALRPRGLLAGHRAPALQAAALPPLPRPPCAGSYARRRTEGHKSFTGELVGASDDAVTIAADGALVAIPYAEIQRSNLIEE